MLLNAVAARGDYLHEHTVACYVAVAVIWLVPDRRVERFVAAAADGEA